MYCIKIPTWLFGLIKIALITLVFSAITSVITIFYARQIIMDSWDEYRCNPMVIPFAGMFGHDSSETMTQCMFMNFKASSKYHMLPYVNTTNVVTDAIGKVAGGMYSLSSLTNSVQTAFGNSFKDIVGKIGNFNAVLYYLLVKMETILQRLVAIVVVAMYTLFSMLQGLKAIGNDKSLKNTVDTILNFPRIPKIKALKLKK
jgi:hypothetical protein